AFVVLDCTNTCTSPGMSTFGISVSGEASQAFGPICAHNSQGELIRTVSNCDTCEMCVGSGIIQLSRGIPYFASSFPSVRGPQLQTPCGPISTNARWFGLAKDGSYPEGIADLSTEGSSYDTVMFVYRGPLTSPTNLTLLACNDDINAVNHQSRVLFRF